MKEFLSKCDNCSILVLGDIIIDEYQWGHIERISPEAPVPILRQVSEEHTLGGAGNVVKNLRSLGCKALLVGAVGNDEAANQVVAELRSLGVSTEGIIYEEGRITTRKSRQISLETKQQVFRIDREAQSPIDRQSEDDIIRYVENHLASVQAVILSDYHKGVITRRVAESVIQMANDQGVITVAQPKTDLSKYIGVTVLVPNKKEATHLYDETTDSEDTISSLGYGLMEKSGAKAILITRGAEGLSLFSGSRRLDIPANAQDVFDVTGAGDTTISVFTLAIAVALSYEDAAQLANKAAGIVVKKLKTATVSRHELENVFAPHTRCWDEKIIDEHRLNCKLKEMNSRGLKVVFTNGCFDVLHIGHIHLLNRAREMGDLLIVGMNSDASVRRLKGHKRPLMGQTERARLLASLEMVDYVVTFDDDTPHNLIKIIRPHFLVKGEDYALSEVIGKAFVEANGGSVELVDFVEGRSSSRLIEEIQAS